ncbi:MAG: helix-turn-helix transcriptional regulator [Fibrobacteria bacterium]|nr:helix-turn-helix transcriptional regulator [Fibrobacteria bacterium]
MEYEIGNMLRYHRKKTGHSQKELAKLAGIGKTAVFDMEQDKKTIQLDTLLKVCKALNIKMKFDSELMEDFLDQQEAQDRC